MILLSAALTREHVTNSRLSMQEQKTTMSGDYDDLPKGDILEAPDFNALLVENPVATFAVRISGKSMTGAGIYPGDIAVVNRAREPKNGDIVLAVVDREFTLKRYRNRNGRITLQADNPKFADIEIVDGMDFEVWGVVSSSIRMLT
jgi:DNA polymerase V